MTKAERLFIAAFAAALELKARMENISPNKLDTPLGDMILGFEAEGITIWEHGEPCVMQAYVRNYLDIKCKASENEEAHFNTSFALDESSCIATLSFFMGSNKGRYKYVFTPIISDFGKSRGLKQSQITAALIFEDALKGKGMRDYDFIWDTAHQNETNEELLRLIANCCHVCEKVNTFLSDIQSAGKTPGIFNTSSNPLAQSVEREKTQIEELKIGDSFYLSENALGTGENILRGKTIDIIFVNPHKNELIVIYEGSNGAQSWELDNVIKSFQNGDYVLSDKK